MSHDSKRARDEASAFVSAHHPSAEMTWEQERKLRLSCEFRHLRYRHVDDLVTVIHKILASDVKAHEVLVRVLLEFSARDNVDPSRASSGSLSQEQLAYAERISTDPKDLRKRYPGDLAQIIEALVRDKYSSEDVVTKELQRINIVQSDARKKMRK